MGRRVVETAKNNVAAGIVSGGVLVATGTVDTVLESTGLKNGSTDQPVSELEAKNNELETKNNELKAKVIKLEAENAELKTSILKKISQSWKSWRNGK